MSSLTKNIVKTENDSVWNIVAWKTTVQSKLRYFPRNETKFTVGLLLS